MKGQDKDEEPIRTYFLKTPLHLHLETNGLTASFTFSR
jgi:hypothetical protein